MFQHNENSDSKKYLNLDFSRLYQKFKLGYVTLQPVDSNREKTVLHCLKNTSLDKIFFTNFPAINIHKVNVYKHCHPYY